ncbi:hypothetical protein OCGS_2794 [Oceaniovalibus guishaninsula JLT2003]|uniref:Uncharacterized protein n=1 Tax=Oceaniovalibus guishaninsula JLT2003 TaxID=1231392 RepID=K2H6H0_9RHOB|nr:hypothetical protein [Oceaniovalibus guishaninsula]EKE43203.1 hypothetical protein OCGS_2794 [Oceaniovalibus guishaninsula JLT2003]
MNALGTKTLAFCLALAIAPASAQDAADQAALDTMLARMTQALEAGDMAVTMEVLPPTMLDRMAEQSGLDRDRLLEVTRAQIEAAGDTVTFSEVDFGGDGIDWKTTEAGADYALVPSESVIEVRDPASDATMRMRQTATFIAIPDAGQWYMVDISSPEQQAIFADAYPDYAGITVPPAAVEVAP